MPEGSGMKPGDMVTADRPDMSIGNVTADRPDMSIGNMQLASPAAGVTTVIPRNLREPEVDGPEPQALRDVDDALDVYDEARALRGGDGAQDGEREPDIYERAKTYERKAAPSLDTSTIEGNYFDDELPPIMQPKEPEPIKPEKRPSKFWRILAGIDGNVPFEHFDRQDAAYERRQKEATEKQRNEQLAKPDSKESRQAQNKWRPYLQAAGWSDGDIARMSAADVAGLNLADVSDFRVKSRQKRDELAAQRAADEARRDEDQAIKERHRGEDLTNQGVRDERQNAAAMERARVVGGQRAGERAGVRAAENEREDARLAAQARRDYELKREQAGINRTKTIVDRLRRNITAARDANKGEIFGTQDEVLRRGPKDGWGFMSSAARAVMEDLQLLQNTQIKDTSGAAVTVSEMPRVVAGFGTGIFSGEGDIERYLDRYEEEVDAVDNGYARAYAQGSYGAPAPSPPPSRGGGGKGGGGKGGGAKRVRYTDPNTGGRMVAPATPAALEALKAAGVDYEEVE
jgi:hypothetical protein